MSLDSLALICRGQDLFTSDPVWMVARLGPHLCRRSDTVVSITAVCMNETNAALALSPVQFDEGIGPNIMVFRGTHSRGSIHACFGFSFPFHPLCRGALRQARALL